MNRGVFDQFIKLVELDEELYQSIIDKANLVHEIELLELEIENIQININKSYQNILHLKKESNALELEINSLNSEYANKKNKINNASNTKEYYYLEQEIQNLTVKSENAETELFNIWNNLDIAQENYNNLLKKSEEKKKPILEDIKNFHRRVEYLINNINQLNKKRPELTSLVDPEILEQYNLMKESVHNPAVKVVNKSCYACFYLLTQQDYYQVSQNNLPRCRNCFRFLYLKDQKTDQDDLS